MSKETLTAGTLRRVSRWPTGRSKKWTAQFLKSAQHDRNIRAIVAIGSAVRPAVSSVDLDLLVLCEEPTAFKAKPPMEIDLRVYAAKQVSSLIEGGNDLVGWAVKFGRALFQREGFWDSVLKAWSDTVPLPSLETAMQRAEDSFRRLNSVLEVGDSDAAHELAVSYLTHLSRAELIKRRVYPASRPELPEQLRSVGCSRLAAWLDGFLSPTLADSEQVLRALIDRRSTTNCA